MKAILGTMNFGPQVNTEDSQTMVNRFLESKLNELDTAYVYNDGDTERILGEVISKFPDQNLKVATKVHPRITGSLDKRGIHTQFDESLRRMGRDSVDILYLHFPDAVTPIEETLEVCAKLHEEGKFTELGLSNYPAWKVMEIWHICKARHWVLPTVYQGMYNGLTRSVETELFPALRRLGMRFYAFNPLAGGMLTGKHKEFEKVPDLGRFARLKSYRNRYWKKTYFEAVEHLSNVCELESVVLAEAAYRWMCEHSMLSAEHGDGVIVGASSIGQLEKNLTSMQGGLLPEAVLEAFDLAWLEAKPDCPPYFNEYSSQ